jgi:hypothetical protein
MTLAIFCRPRAVSWGAPIIGVLGMLATDAPAASRFDALLGAWSGSGRSMYQDGQAEPIRCTGILY